MAVLNLNLAPNVLLESNNYERTLRVIGQDLNELYPEELEIKVTGAEFITSGVGLTQSLHEQTKRASTVQTAWNRLMGKESKPGLSGVPRPRQRFTRKYTLDDINRLDEKGLPTRVNKEGTPDIYNLGERLRTVGRIVDSCGGTLIRVVKDSNSMKFEYRDKDGSDHKEEYTNLALYKDQQRYYAERGKYAFIDPWHIKS